jgi:hypothetical protein
LVRRPFVAQVEAEDKKQVVKWLADAPLFIDADYVTAMYDAVIRPESQTKTTKISTYESERKERDLEAKLGVKASLPNFLQTLIPGLGLSVEASGGAAGKAEAEQRREQTIELSPIDNPHRQLIHLTVHYLVNLPNRIVVDKASDRGWIDDAFASTLPKALVFMDLPLGTKFVPTAAELRDGRVITFYDKLALALAVGGMPSPKDYPASKPGTDEKALRAERKAYWHWFDEFFQPERANRIVENSIGDGGPISWINYRMPLDGEGTTLHLSLAGRKRYDTGVFAYDFVQRGFRHGLRIVGALRSEPSLKVLAVFER